MKRKHLLKRFLAAGFAVTFAFNTVSGVFATEQTDGGTVVEAEAIPGEVGTQEYADPTPDVEKTREIGVNYWDIENNKQAGEGKVTVEADANNVNTSALTDVPAGYELASAGDVPINDGWIYVEVRPAAKTKNVGVNYYSFEEGKQIAESSVEVDADAVHVNTGFLTDVPEGYELVWTGDLLICDGWVFAEVRKAEMSVNVTYFTTEGEEFKGQPLVVSKDATYINTSKLTDVPEGYEIVWTGDEPIRDGEVRVEIRRIETTKSIAIEYYIKAEDRTIEGQSVKVDKEATYINTSILKDIPEGYELVWAGDIFIEDGKVKVEIRAKKLDVYFVIEDGSMGSFRDAAESLTISFTALEAGNGKQYEIPAVSAKEGFVFKGWKDSTGAISWEAAKTGFEVTPGMGAYPEGAENGILTVYAQFEKAAETPATETPATETPATETPATETPGTETPATETPATEMPGTETPATDSEQSEMNDPQPEEPDDLEEPDDSDDTKAPADKDSDSSDKSSGDVSDGKAVNTGDHTPLFFYGLMMAAAAAVFAIAVKIRRMHVN